MLLAHSNKVGCYSSLPHTDVSNIWNRIWTGMWNGMVEWNDVIDSNENCSDEIVLALFK